MSSDVFVVIIFIYVLFPLFVLFMSTKIATINLYRFANWQYRMLWGTDMPKKFYGNVEIRRRRKNQGIKLFYISLICGAIVVLEFLFFPKDGFLYLLAIFFFIITAFLEVLGGFLYGMARREEILEGALKEESEKGVKYEIIHS